MRTQVTRRATWPNPWPADANCASALGRTNPAATRNPKWRGPESNRRHHDFQSAASSSRTARKVLQNGGFRNGLRSRKYPQIPFLSPRFGRWAAGRRLLDRDSELVLGCGGAATHPAMLPLALCRYCSKRSRRVTTAQLSAQGGTAGGGAEGASGHKSGWPWDDRPAVRPSWRRAYGATAVPRAPYASHRHHLRRHALRQVPRDCRPRTPAHVHRTSRHADETSSNDRAHTRDLTRAYTGATRARVTQVWTRLL